MAGVHLRRLVGLFAGYRPKAEGSLEPHFFGSSQQAAWGASRSVWKGSRKLSDLNIFSGYISEGWRGFLQGIDQKPKAVLSCSFSSYRSGPPEWFSVEDQLKSRRQSRAVLFRVIAAGRLGSLAVGVERQLKAAWHEHLFGVHLRTLAGIFVGD